MRGQAYGKAVEVLKTIRSYYRNSPAAFISGIIIFLFILVAILAPLLTAYEYDAIDLSNRFAAPGYGHIFGTDELGRDFFTRVLYGSRISLLVGIVSTVLSTFIGVVLGVIAGFSGKFVEAAIMRVTDVALAFPSLLLTMVIMFTLGGGMLNMFIAIALVNWAGTARIIYAQTLRIKEATYIEYARLAGLSRPEIIFRHIIPNCTPEIIAVLTMDIPSAIIAESTLSFLGLGISKPVASWGTLVNTGRQYLFTNPMMCIIPCAAIAALVLAFNIFGRNIEKLRGYDYE